MGDNIAKKETAMRDEFAIQQTISRYSDAASRLDWEQLLATFTSDAVWEAPGVGAKCVGRAAIRQTMAPLVAPLAYLVQMNAPAIITINGDKAAARSAIRESGKYADRDVALEVLGYYDDDLVRTPEGWRFARRTFIALASRSFALLPAGRPA
jgi:ketosteroid isomerase-like protein